MEFSEAEPTPFHAVTASCSRPNGLATRRVNRGLQVFSLSNESFNPCHDLSCHDTDGIQIQRWRCIR